MNWKIAGGMLLGIAAASGMLPLRGAEKMPGTGPWNVKELQKTPKFTVGMAQEVKEGDQSVQISEVYYDGEPWIGKPTRVFAYYARPSVPKEKKLPAMVLVHGGGGTAFPEWARLWAARGYAAIAMDLSGRGPERKRLEDGGPEQDHEWKFQHMKDGLKNVWSYQAVAAVIRGTSVLRALPDVDSKRMGITGISWGGYLTTIVMSLDDRLKLAAPVYGCGYLHENSAWLSNLAALPPDERAQWIENFDPSRYLPRCKIPVLWVNGTNDFAYPLDSYQKSYRATRGPRTLCIKVKMPHGHVEGWAPPEIGLFADSFFKRNDLAQALPQILGTQVDGDKIKIAYTSEAAALKSQVHWTTDLDKPWAERDWKTANGTVTGLDDAEVPLPPNRPCIYFLTLIDSRGAVVSTEHAELR